MDIMNTGLEAKDFRVMIRAYIPRLTKKEQRDVLTLRYHVPGLSLAETAAALGLSSRERARLYEARGIRNILRMYRLEQEASRTNNEQHSI